MEEPIPIPQPEVKRIDPLGAFPFLNNPRNVKMIGLCVGVGVLGTLLVVKSHKAEQQPTVPVPVMAQANTGPAVPQEWLQKGNQPTGAAESARSGIPTAGQTPAASPQINEGPAQVSPEEQQRQQLLDQRRQMEMKAAFASSVVSVDSAKKAEPVNAPAVPRYAPQQPASIEQISAKPKDELAFSADLQTYTLPEHTTIPAVLDSRIDGEQAGPLDALVSMNIYLPNSRTLIVPQGAKVLGETSKVTATGQQRMAVTFHRILIYAPGASKPYAISLDDKTPGLDQAGTVGLHDKVNNHYGAIFGASLAIGMISGISQLGSYNATYNPMYGFYNGVSQSASQNSSRVLDRFLNRMPTLTIREGTRMLIELLGDVDAPAYPGRS